MTVKKKRGRPAKSSFYYVRWYKVKLNQERAAQILGASIEEIEQWDWKGNNLAERYLMLWDKKHLHGEWKGFTFSRGSLRYKGYQWTPETLKNQISNAPSWLARKT